MESPWCCPRPPSWPLPSLLSALPPCSLQPSPRLLGLSWSTSILSSHTVAGEWAVWGAWGPCSVSCGGGHRSRQRSCVDPPPKNGGAPCPGASHEGAPCALQPCTGDTGKGTGLDGGIQGWSPAGVGLLGKVPGPPVPTLPSVPLPPDCGLGRIHISAELCRKGLVPPCPPSCLDPEANRSCSGHCLEGEPHPASRSAAGRALGEGARQPSVSSLPSPLPPPWG